MFAFINWLFDLVLRKLVAFAGFFPDKSDDINSAQQFGQWGLLWMGATVECYVLDLSDFMVELRHEFGPRFGYHVWWIKLFGMNFTEGTRTLYILGLRFQWDPLLPTQDEVAENRRQALKQYASKDLPQFVIEYAIPNRGTYDKRGYGFATKLVTGNGCLWSECKSLRDQGYTICRWFTMQRWYELINQRHEDLKALEVSNAWLETTLQEQRFLLESAYEQKLVERVRRSLMEEGIPYEQGSFTDKIIGLGGLDSDDAYQPL